MAKLTVKYLESITSAQAGETLREDGNLFGKVSARKSGVSISFYYRFKWNGKLKDVSCGTWPKTPISEIRQARDDAKQLLSKGIDPAAARKAERLEAQAEIEAALKEAELKKAEALTVADLFETWLRDGVARQDGNAELMRSFNKDVLPYIGKHQLRHLSDKYLIMVLRRVKSRGLNRSVVILNNDISQMLRWGEKRKPWRPLMTDGNPADLVDVKKLLDRDYQEERDRVLSPVEIRELWHIFLNLEESYKALPAGSKYSGIRPVNKRVQCAVWICLSTLCRIGELLKAQWQHVDLESGYWFIPAANTKGQRGKRQDHHVFLSEFAKEQFQRLKQETGSTPYLFPNRSNTDHVNTKTVSKLIGDRQCRFKDRSKPLAGRHHDDSLVLAKGVNGEWTPHDMRRTGATMMQAKGVPLDIIDRCQNHLLGGSKVRRHYLMHDYAKEKADAWKSLGDELHKILDL